MAKDNDVFLQLLMDDAHAPDNWVGYSTLR